jgi:hypothetical protein
MAGKEEKTIFIKLIGYGDYDLTIYKVNKENDFISSLMNHFYKDHMIEVNWQVVRNTRLEFIKNNMHFDANLEYEKIKKNNQHKSFKPQTFKQMCSMLRLRLEIYPDIECNNECSSLFMENDSGLVLDISYKQINLYKFIFNKIFCHKYSDMINYKIIHDDGNCRTIIFEFYDSYFIIDYR